ncbi:Complex 1 LYR [Pyrenophora seminiperda CCB06]|uniref:Complex 1 LYR n=1 Tax=Pyrenophora seminiperda CCB06 TaxID=1302712 RepID=A0A3M7ME03_9PLEO|nr:Complex 1 LYR [Pyrenophora seminiperda CCB06]
MSQEAIVHAYRHLYRHSLRAIQFSKPARYTLRDHIRLAFRRGSATDYEPRKVQNTVEFLQYAAKENGLEHKIVKNLLFVWWVQKNGRARIAQGKNM